MTSNVGAKESAIKLKPDTFLHAFSSFDDVNLRGVLSKGCFTIAVPTFDELRFENYTGKKATLINLPPTSNSTKGLFISLFLYHLRAN